MSHQNEVYVGTPNPECAACGKHFDSDSDRKGRIRFQPWAPFDIFMEYSLCGACFSEGSASPKAAKRVAARALKYHNGEA